MQLSLVLPAAAADDAMPAASFACERASGTDEQVICSDPLLRQADHALGETFEAVIAETTETGRREAIRADEHGWILRRNKECGVTKATKLAAADLPDYVDCFLDAYDERMADLAQMKAGSAIAPSDISTPIRKPLPIAETPPTLPADIFIRTGLTLADTGRRRVIWLADGRLIVLGRGPAAPGIDVYDWQQGHADIVGGVESVEKIDRICSHGDEIALLPVKGDVAEPEQILAGADLNPEKRKRLDPALAAACGLGDTRRRIYGADTGTWLDTGPVPRDSTDLDERYVRLARGGELHRVEPEIRIDRRYRLQATYLLFAKSFVVGVAEHPAAIEAAVERRWAKTSCLPFWQIEEASGTAARACIPYGSYVGNVPEPLPTQAGLFFAVGDAGLYRIADGQAKPIIAGAVRSPVVSPNGCAIAFAGADPKSGGERPVLILDVCKLAGKSAL